MIADDENFYMDRGRRVGHRMEPYIEHALPYKKVIYIINTIYEVNDDNLSTDGFQILNTSGVKPMDRFTMEEAESFYTSINRASIARIDSLSALSQREKDKHMEMLSQVKTPFYNDHYDGYLYFDKNLQVIALILMVTIAICISPIFSNEYYLKTDRIVLSSRYGKNKLISAKLFTGITFSAGVAVMALFGSLLTMLWVHGFSGADMAIQMIGIYSTYPLTILDASLIAIAVTIFITVLFGMLTMLLSSCLKSSFFVIIISFLLLLFRG